MKLSGQHRLNKNATQLASSENAFWNSESERPSHRGVRPGDLTRTLHLEQPEFKRDKPLLEGVAGAGGAAVIAAPYIRNANAAETTVWEVQTSWPAGSD